MGVDVGGHLDARVTKPFLDILQGEAHFDEQAGAGVPQLMETDVREIVLFQKPVESVADVVGGVLCDDRVEIYEKLFLHRSSGGG